MIPNRAWSRRLAAIEAHLAVVTVVPVVLEVLEGRTATQA